MESMFKRTDELHTPDPYFSGAAGFIGCSLEELHGDMRELGLPVEVPDTVRRCHNGVRHAYIYSYYSFDLLTVAAAQIFPCLELALRERLGLQFAGRHDRKGKLRPPVMLDELLRAAKAQGLISIDVEGLSHVRNLFAHGTDAVMNPPLFLGQFKLITATIAELFASPLLAGQERQ